MYFDTLGSVVVENFDKQSCYFLATDSKDEDISEGENWSLK